MQTLKVWNYMVWDGGSDHNHRAYFNQETTSKYDAITLAGSYDEMRAETIVVYQSTQEYFDERNKSIRKKAIAKLTKEELLALGVE